MLINEKSLYNGHDLTVVGAVPGQPLPFGTVGGSDDADVVPSLDWQIVFTALCCYQHRRLVQSLLLSCGLTDINTHTHNKKVYTAMPKDQKSYI